jgi:hypothetical protein
VITIAQTGFFFRMTHLPRFSWLLASSFVVALAACSSDEQSLGKNDLGVTGTDGGAAGSFDEGPGGNAGAPNEPAPGGAAGTGSLTVGGSGGAPGSAGSVNPPGQAGAGGFAGSPPVMPAQRICDGNDGITLGRRVIGGYLPASEALPLEVGYRAFYVDGHCQYWIINAGSDGQYAWREARTGTLGAEDEIKLATDFGYAQWPAIYGDYTDPAAFSSDAGRTEVFDRQGRVSCIAKCLDDAPSAAKGHITYANAWVDALFAQGSPLPAGPMRMRAFANADTSGSTALPLTLSVSLASLVGTTATPFFGDAPLLENASDIAALRALRAQVLGGAAGLPPRFHVLAPDGAAFTVSFRDSLPFENEHGLIPSPANAP